MRIVLRSLPLLLATASPLLAQEEPAAGQSVNLLEPHGGLMFWTLLIFVVLLFVLSKFAFKPILAAVEAREKALEDAIEGAKRDRDAAAQLLAQQQAALDASRGEAQKYIADARGVAEKMRADLLEQTRKEQADLLERARRDIEGERDKAIAQLRREAVELAILGASKVIEENLDSDKNRKLVESYLSSIGSNKVTS
jgi:F-type H+-transporting ATPase subunit b